VALRKAEALAPQAMVGTAVPRKAPKVRSPSLTPGMLVSAAALATRLAAWAAKAGEFGDIAEPGREARAASGDQPARGTGAAGEDTRPPVQLARANGPPLPDRDPSEDAPEGVADTMRQRKPETEDDDRPPDGEEPPRTFLGKMGANPADEKRYTTAWSAGRQRPTAGSDSAPPLGRARTAAGPEDGRLLEAGEGAGARPVVVPADADAGERGRLIHAAEVRVSPRLRPAVRAYFERIGRLGAID